MKTKKFKLPKKADKKEIEKFLKTIPPEILSTLGIVVAFYAVGILNHFLIHKNKDLTQKK